MSWQLVFTLTATPHSKDVAASKISASREPPEGDIFSGRGESALASAEACGRRVDSEERRPDAAFSSTAAGKPASHESGSASHGSASHGSAAREPAVYTRMATAAAICRFFGERRDHCPHVERHACAMHLQ